MDIPKIEVFQEIHITEMVDKEVEQEIGERMRQLTLKLKERPKDLSDEEIKSIFLCSLLIFFQTAHSSCGDGEPNDLTCDDLCPISNRPWK